MNVNAAPLAEAVPGVGLASDLAALSVLKDPGHAAAVWPRRMPVEVRDWLAGLDPDRLPQGRVVLPAHGVARVVRDLCDRTQMPRGAERDWFQADVACLAGMFAEVMSVEYLRLRLDPITTNACRKFHVDMLTARLVCTYRGQGTQYGIGADGEDPDQVFQVETGAPILLRGTLWPESPPSGLKHRSPPIEGTGETRLLLVLDPVTDPLGEE